jgi:hypothetical protein
MVGFPFSYGDKLSEKEARENLKLFFKKYGSTICINGIIFLFANKAYAVDHKPKLTPGDVTPVTQTPAPVFQPIIPPAGIINSKTWSVLGIGSIGWICITALATRDLALIFACSSLVIYPIGGK